MREGGTAKREAGFAPERAVSVCFVFDPGEGYVIIFTELFCKEKTWDVKRRWKIQA